MATSKRIARKASKLLKKSKSFTVREVAGSDLAQAKRTRKKPARRITRRARRR
jgi:hypothetical protein